MSHLHVELQPAAWQQPGACPLSAAGRAKRSSSRSEPRALHRSAASPLGWSRSVGPGSSASLVQKINRVIKNIQRLYREKKKTSK